MSSLPNPLHSLIERNATLPFLTADLPGVDGSIKQSPEDFAVEEIPAYLPSGAGEHLYLWIEKRDLNTTDAVARLARLLDADPREAGYAGLKDRRAVTRQWLSFHHPRTPEAEELSVENLRVLAVSRHANKLRTGHLRGNRFTVRLCGVPLEHEPRIASALERIGEHGLPNYYGAQRFGHDGRNLGAAYAWIVGGERAPSKPFLRKLYVSVLQAALFNVWLADRIERGHFASALPGDILRKEDTGGPFVCTDPTVDGDRVLRWEISPTGPLFGARMRAPLHEASSYETELLTRYGITEAHLERVRKFGEGARRPARVRLESCELERDGADVVLSFVLPKGSYATVLLAELTKSPPLTLGDDP